MTSLVEDVAEDRMALEIETEELVSHLIDDARHSLLMYDDLNPVAAAVIGAKKYTWALLWDTPQKKQEIFDELVEFFDENNATSTIFGYQKDNELVFAVETPAWRELIILPYTRTPQGVTFLKERRISKFTSPFTQTCLN